MFWLIPLALLGVTAVGAFVVAMAQEERAAEKGDAKAVPPKSARRRKLRAAIGVAQAPDVWLRFFEVVAKHESDFNPRAHNSRVGEVAASKRLNERVGTVEGINFNTPAWTYGSKGLFQFLGAVIAVRKGKLRFDRSLTEPDMGYDPGISFASALDFARGLMGWKQFAGTWASLWVGWGNPSKMGDPKKIANAAASLHSLGDALGWPDGWALEQVPALPARGRAALGAIAGAATLAYEGAP